MTDDANRVGLLDDYQAATRRTAGTFRTSETALTCWSLGLCGESGEFADVVKKWIFHGHDLPPNKLADELGDVLWYVAAAADALGYPLSVIAERNIAKLRARYPDGFSSERSINRQESPL